MLNGNGFQDIDCIVVCNARYVLQPTVVYFFRRIAAKNARIAAKRRVLFDGDGVAAGFGVTTITAVSVATVNIQISCVSKRGIAPNGYIISLCFFPIAVRKAAIYLERTRWIGVNRPTTDSYGIIFSISPITTPSIYLRTISTRIIYRSTIDGDSIMFGIAINAITTDDVMIDIAVFDMNLVVSDISRDIRTTTKYFSSYSATLDIDLVARDVAAFWRICTIN